MDFYFERMFQILIMITCISLGIRLWNDKCGIQVSLFEYESNVIELKIYLILYCVFSCFYVRAKLLFHTNFLYSRNINKETRKRK